MSEASGDQRGVFRRGMALIGAAAVVCGAVVVFLLVQMTDVDSNGVGVKKAEARCTDKAPSCLPEIDMVDVQGEVFTPDLLRGRVVVVNFWATWCKPCQREIPALSGLYKRYKDRGVYMLGVMTDDVPLETLEAFVKRTSMSFPVIRADDDILMAWEYPEALPTTFIYGADGHLVLKKRGEISEAELEEVLKTEVAKAEAGKTKS